MQGACLVIVHVCMYVENISVHVHVAAVDLHVAVELEISLLETSVTCNVRCVRVHVMNPETDDNNNNATGTRKASRRSRPAEADRPVRTSHRQHVPTFRLRSQESRCEV